MLSLLQVEGVHRFSKGVVAGVVSRVLDDHFPRLADRGLSNPLSPLVQLTTAQTALLAQPEVEGLLVHYESFDGEDSGLVGMLEDLQIRGGRSEAEDERSQNARRRAEESDPRIVADIFVGNQHDLVFPSSL